MIKKDYELIAGSIFRSGYMTDKNKVRQEAKEKMRRLIATDLIATLEATYPNFNKQKFTEACSFGL